MPILKLSAPKTMRLLSSHILRRYASNFPCSHLDLNNFSRGETPDPCWGGEGKKRGGEGVIGFLPLKGEERTGEWEREGKVGERKGQQQGGGSCSKVLGGIDAPVCTHCFYISFQVHLLSACGRLTSLLCVAYATLLFIYWWNMS